MKRSISRAKQKQKQQNDIDFANVCCFKFFEFEFFEFLLIDSLWLIADFETEIVERWIKCWRIDDWQKIAKKTNLFRLKNKFIDFSFSRIHVICFHIVVCNKFIFVDIDCENVKNRTHAFWNRFSRLSKNVIEANSLVVVTNSLNVVETNKSLRQKRNETKRINFFVLILNDCLLIWWFDVKLLWMTFIFFYQTMFQRFKKMIVVNINSNVNELTDSNKKIVYWLIDWLEEQEDRLLIRMSFKQTDWLIDFE